MSERSNPLSSIFSPIVMAIVAAAVIVGIALGMGLSSTATSSSPENVASRQYIDEMAPNSQVCVQYGASAVTMDARFFVTFNPFSVYVSRPKMQPGCVLRSTDWAVLEQRKLVTNNQERECKNNMNTFGFTGNLESSPQIDCVYRNDAAGNLFLTQAGVNSQSQ
jgi:hypothetical protein